MQRRKILRPCHTTIRTKVQPSPTAIVQVNEFNEELYVKELLYRNDMHNNEIFA